MMVEKSKYPGVKSFERKEQPYSPGGTVSLKELAAYVGLSPATVSRVINRSAQENRIALSTQERVLAAAQKLHYKPNIFARGLRNRRSFTAGVIVPEISEGYSTGVLGGIEDGLLQEGFFYFVVSHRHRRELLEEYPHLLLSRAVEGIITVDSTLQRPMPVPVVAVSGHSRLHADTNIQLDHVLAVRAALGHLKQLGHCRIAFIKGQEFSSDTAPRWNAIQKVAAELGLTVDPELTVQLEGARPGAEPGRIAAVRLIERSRRFTAIFAFNDLSAIGAIAALHDAGLHVPRDVSVVGFDDIPGAATNNPALTTVHQPLNEMGRIAASTLLELIQQGPDRVRKKMIRVLPTFVVRESTAAVRESASQG